MSEPTSSARSKPASPKTTRATPQRLPTMSATMSATWRAWARTSLSRTSARLSRRRCSARRSPTCLTTRTRCACSTTWPLTRSASSSRASTSKGRLRRRFAARRTFTRITRRCRRVAPTPPSSPCPSSWRRWASSRRSSARSLCGCPAPRRRVTWPGGRRRPRRSSGRCGSTCCSPSRWSLAGPRRPRGGSLAAARRLARPAALPSRTSSRGRCRRLSAAPTGARRKTCCSTTAWRFHPCAKSPSGTCRSTASALTSRRRRRCRGASSSACSLGSCSGCSSRR
ncbi:hypothetical protein BU14_2277s0001 [Porphyra umbilicalis]|uniref:Uncharacterized protein n=1 Tax=Porphyra umbilicalis TaxID=2786 RepID=A0A1X6NJG6_PORUM|nr:hypothetical protein BU14_2277s0001 [Porphyra umbilicalis]|eukprot:OSX68764.1 hypothetical protein BU14_2277s0001 [Porphyra umbilicalis]